MNGLTDEQMCELANIILEQLANAREKEGLAGRDTFAEKVGKMSWQELKELALKIHHNGDNVKMTIGEKFDLETPGGMLGSYPDESSPESAFLLLPKQK